MSFWSESVFYLGEVFNVLRFRVNYFVFLSFCVFNYKMYIVFILGIMIIINIVIVIICLVRELIFKKMVINLFEGIRLRKIDLSFIFKK